MKLRNPLNHFPVRSCRLSKPFSDRLDWYLYLVVLVGGAGFALYIKEIGLSLLLVDQYSHLAISRQITDSLTPGVSQIGFWPPLLHVIIAPFALFDGLYYTGYASAVALVPFLGLTVVWLSRLLFLLSGERMISYGFAALLLLNPYILYFSVTPMMEVLFLAMLTGSAYYFSRWWFTNELSALILTGTFISLASLSRFEGFVLLPLVMLLIIGRLLMLRTKLTQIEAAVFIFGLIAATGLLFTLAYGAVYNGNPMAFMSNDWGADAQQSELYLPSEGNWVASFIVMGAAANEMFGAASLVIVALCTLLLVVAIRTNRLLVTSVLLIIISPFLFDVLAAYRGSTVVNVPYLWPYPDGYFNVRYGLLTAIAVVSIPALAAAYIARQLRPKVTRFWLPFHTLPAVVIGIFMLVSGVSFSMTDGCAECFPIITNSQQLSPADHAEAAEVLRNHYDGGYILMTRALHNEIAVRAEIPLRYYIMEANEHYYGRAVEAPWWYARYVVMFNPSDNIHQAWQQENEVVSRTWASNPTFHHFYEQIFLSDGEAVYHLREQALIEHALAHSIPLSAVPALQTSQNTWDVEETYELIKPTLATTHETNNHTEL